MAMSREEKNEFATWFYRGIIGILLSLTFIVVKSNYDEFQEMKFDVQRNKIEHVNINQRFERVESRLLVVEKLKQ